MISEVMKFRARRPLNAEQQKLFDNMKREISQNTATKAVSFEMFETLIVRPFFDRRDMFLLMEEMFKGLYVGKKSFYDLRCEAEERALKRTENKCACIDEIYAQLQKISGISPSSREKLLKRELELEEYFCYPRRLGKELWKTAKDSGKKCVIIAETYLPAAAVERILRNCGYGGWDKLFVTNDYTDKPKAPEGLLYAHICEKMKLKAAELLHFGGSFEADVEAPIKQGVRAVMITTCRDRLIKSGRLCGWLQKNLVYEFCSQKYLALRCVLALYGVYAFDYPHGKLPQSDFCGDEYMLGFMASGAMTLHKDFVISDETDMMILGALSENEKCSGGCADFRDIFNAHFGDSLNKYGYEGCQLAFEYLLRHGAIGDRMCLQRYISNDITEKWSKQVTEPEIAPVYTGEAKASALSRLADKLFPPGTQVRTYADGILAKLRR